MSVGHLYFFGKMSTQVLDINPLSVYDLQVFSLIWQFAFSFSWFPLLCIFSRTPDGIHWSAQRFLLLITYLSSFSFVSYAFGVTSKKPLLSPRSQLFIAMFFYENFPGLVLIFMSLLHFGLIFMYSNAGTQLHSFVCGCPVVLAPCVKKAILSLLSRLGIFVICLVFDLEEGIQSFISEKKNVGCFSKMPLSS